VFSRAVERFAEPPVSRRVHETDSRFCVVTSNLTHYRSKAKVRAKV
jgi:hypothetical protein